MLLALLLLSDGLSATPPETRPFGWKCALCSSVGAGVLGMAVMTHSDVTGLPGRSSLTAVASWPEWQQIVYVMSAIVAVLGTVAWGFAFGYCNVRTWRDCRRRHTKAF